jgi:2-C-methyl-D-erythritol 4-phosphate cytidylyltransferase
MKASAIIVAAGSGTRLGFATPKAFVRVGDSTLLGWTLRTLREVAAIGEVVIAVPAGAEADGRAEVSIADLEVPVKIVAGGIERQDSVRIALALTSAEAEIVVIHDAARPFADPALFAASVEAADRAGGAIAAVPVADSLKRVAGRAIIATEARAGLWQAQTPQAFRRVLIVEAHARALRDSIIATDDADLVERLGVAVEVVTGTPTNFKITAPEDLVLAAAIAKSR